MTVFYKIEQGKAQVGSGELIPPEFTEYVVGQEPKELLEILQIEQAQIKLQTKLSEAQSYLTSTDWYFARLADTGEEVPEEVKVKRAEARTFIQENK